MDVHRHHHHHHHQKKKKKKKKKKRIVGRSGTCRREEEEEEEFIYLFFNPAPSARFVVVFVLFLFCFLLLSFWSFVCFVASDVLTPICHLAIVNVCMIII